MSSLARLVETTLSLAEVATTDATEKVSLDQADKYSVEVTATVGDSIAHLQGSNVQEPGTAADSLDWTELDSDSIAEDASTIFEVPDASYRWTRIMLENDDIVDVSADCLFLVIGDAV